MDVSIIRTLFVIYMMFMAGSVTNIMGCRLRNLIKNIYIKHFGLIMLIYFSIVLSREKYDTIENNLILTFKIWIFYIIFVRVNVTVSIIVIILSLLLITLMNYQSYIEDNKKEKTDDFHNVSKIISYLKKIIPIITVIGFIIYIINNYKKKNLSFIKLVLGDFNC